VIKAADLLPFFISARDRASPASRHNRYPGTPCCDLTLGQGVCLGPVLNENRMTCPKKCKRNIAPGAGWSSDFGSLSKTCPVLRRIRHLRLLQTNIFFLFCLLT